MQQESSTTQRWYQVHRHSVDALVCCRRLQPGRHLRAVCPSRQQVGLGAHQDNGVVSCGTEALQLISQYTETNQEHIQPPVRPKGSTCLNSVRCCK